jgi:hypothetical protein
VASVLSQKLAEKVFSFRGAVPQPWQGRKPWGKEPSPPPPSPLPRGRERGRGRVRLPTADEAVKNSNRRMIVLLRAASGVGAAKAREPGDDLWVYSVSTFRRSPFAVGFWRFHRPAYLLVVLLIQAAAAAAASFGRQRRRTHC